MEQSQNTPNLGPRLRLPDLPGAYGQARSEVDQIRRDAASSEGKSPQERMAAFADLLATVSAVWQHLPEEERRRRMRIADQLHRRPEPWWKNFRAEALAEYRDATAHSAD